MRARWVLGVLMTAACGSEARLPLTLELSADVRTLIVFQRVGSASFDATVVRADAPDAVPTLHAERDSTSDTVVYAYADAPEALSLALGPLAPARDPRAARDVPEPDARYRVTLTPSMFSDDSATFAALAGDPPELLRFKLDCPPPQPLVAIAGCPLTLPPRPTVCWGPLTKLDALDSGGEERGGVPVREGDAEWLYFSTDRASPAGTSFARHARVRLRGPADPDPTTLQVLDDLPAVRGAPGAWEISGWAHRPWVRADGLEMLYPSSYPDAAWWDEDIYVSARASVLDPWPAGTNVIAVGSALLETDFATSPVLLGDRRTLVWRGDGDVAVHGWRPTARAGDRDFVRLGRVMTPDGPLESGDVSLSCDGGHLLYMRGDAPSIARILALPTAVRGGVDGVLTVEPQPFTALTLPPAVRPLMMTESPGCDAIYVSDAADLYAARAVPCP